MPLTVDLVLGVAGGVFMAILVIKYTLSAIARMLTSEHATLTRPFAVPAVLYIVALWQNEVPYMAATMALIATVRFLNFVLTVMFAFAIMKWEEVLVEAVF